MKKFALIIFTMALISAGCSNGRLPGRTDGTNGGPGGGETDQDQGTGGGGGEDQDGGNGSGTDEDTDLPPPLACAGYSGAAQIGRVEHDDIHEASGIVVSRKSEGVLWTHNDSGDTPRVFALNTDGDHLGIYTLQGAAAEDWEDMAAGPGPVAGEQYLYIGDIGSAGHSPFTVYRFAEPDIARDQSAVTVTIADYETINLYYPGSEYNAETLMVDPQNGDIYIITKSGGNTHIYRKAAPHADGDEAQLEEVATIDMNALPGNDETTGGDIDPSGSLIVVRTYSHAFVWERSEGGSIGSAFNAAPCTSLEMEDAGEQGEAIAFTSDGDLITVSEWPNQPLYLYRRNE